MALKAPAKPVALRKESVDRNTYYIGGFQNVASSLSARRAWIEMTTYLDTSSIEDVALRKESVDRNTLLLVLILLKIGCRSPQGERG